MAEPEMFLSHESHAYFWCTYSCDVDIIQPQGLDAQRGLIQQANRRGGVGQRAAQSKGGINRVGILVFRDPVLLSSLVT